MKIRMFWSTALLSFLLLFLSPLATAGTITLDGFNTVGSGFVGGAFNPSRSLYSYAASNSVSVDISSGTATLHRAVDSELGIVYEFSPEILASALTEQTYLRVPILSAPATSLLYLNASYIGGGPAGPDLWSGTRSFIFEPKAGDILVGDLTFALQAPYLPAGFYHDGFYEFRLFIPNGSAVQGDYVVGPLEIVTPSLPVAEPVSLLLVGSGLAGLAARYRRG